MICAWFIRHYGIYFSSPAINAKRSSCSATAPAIFVTLPNRQPHHHHHPIYINPHPRIPILSIKTVHNLESGPPSATVHTFYSKKKKEKKDEGREGRSVQNGCRAAPPPGPRHPSAAEGGEDEWGGAGRGCPGGCARVARIAPHYFRWIAEGALHIKHCSLSRNL